jgi:aspartyl protease family protein
MSDSQGPWGSEHTPDQGKAPVRRTTRLGLALWIGVLAGCVGLVAALSYFLPGRTPGAQDAFEITRLVGLAALVSSGLLAARQINMARAARYAVAWAAILVLLVLLYQDRGDVLSLGRRLAAAFEPSRPVTRIVTADNASATTTTQATPAAMEVEIGKSDGGGFYADGQVNGEPVRFLIDTGSSAIVLSPQDASRVHLPTGGLETPAETANGVATGSEATAESVAVGPLKLTQVPVYVNSAPMSVSLLGLAFLNRLDSYEVHGDQMILKGKQTP